MAVLNNVPAYVGAVPMVAADQQASANTVLHAKAATAMVTPGSVIRMERTAGAPIQMNAPTETRSQSSRRWRMLRRSGTGIPITITPRIWNGEDKGPCNEGSNVRPNAQAAAAEAIPSYAIGKDPSADAPVLVNVPSVISSLPSTQGRRSTKFGTGDPNMTISHGMQRLRTHGKAKGPCNKGSNVRPASTPKINVSRMILVRQMQRLLITSSSVLEALEGDVATATAIRKATASYCILTNLVKKLICCQR